MDNVSANFNLSISCKGDNGDTPAADLGKATEDVTLTRGITLAHGTGSGQVNVIFRDIMAVATLQEIDFNDVALKDAFGVGLAFTKLKALYIKNLTGGDLTIGGASEPLDLFTTSATMTEVIPDDGEWFRTFPGDGLECATANGMLEFVHAVGGAQDVEIIAVGVR